MYKNSKTRLAPLHSMRMGGAMGEDSGTDVSSGRRSGMGGGHGGMGRACFTYREKLKPDRALATPDIVFDRGVYMNGSVTMDDGRQIRIWGFTDGSDGRMGMMGMGGGEFPSPAMRVIQGQIVHTRLSVNMMWAHTIHHHGIEPDTESDGVGHISGDVQGTAYTYQWRPMHPGTYFYHCHTNTVLHAEMGMYGALIVDPPEGRGVLYSGGPHYDQECFWVVDEIDSSWHDLSWEAGTCGEDVGLNALNPDYFVITGIDGARSAMTTAGVAAEMQVGESLLARYICAGYHPQRIRFGGLTGIVPISDGRVLPKAVAVKELRAHSGERYDIIFKPDKPGEYVTTAEICHWITGKVLGEARTRITVY